LAAGGREMKITGSPIYGDDVESNQYQVNFERSSTRNPGEEEEIGMRDSTWWRNKYLEEKGKVFSEEKNSILNRSQTFEDRYSVDVWFKRVQQDWGLCSSEALRMGALNTSEFSSSKVHHLIKIKFCLDIRYSKGFNFFFNLKLKKENLENKNSENEEGNFIYAQRINFVNPIFLNFLNSKKFLG
jgi:hypothetical protein